MESRFFRKSDSKAQIYLTLPYQPTEISGLVRIEAKLAAANISADQLLVKVRCDDAGVLPCEKLVAPEERTGRPFSAVINTHLFRDGENRITFELIDPRNCVIASSSMALKFSNHGGLASRVANSLRRGKTPAVFFDPIDSTLFDYGDLTLTPWFEKKDARFHVNELLTGKHVTSGEAASLVQLVDHGYALLDASIEEDLLARVNADLDEAIQNRWQNYEYGSSQRLEHLHHAYASFRELWTHPHIMRFLNLVFGERARPCQTLTYVFGSQQDLHQDTVHLTAFPAGYMCGVWIALEDIQQDSGELVVVPGSHRWPRIYMRTVDCGRPKGNDWSEFAKKVVGRWEKMVAGSEAELVTYRPKKGAVLVWHENLMHGGSVRLNQTISRRSMVGHYFANGAVVYYDSAGLPGCII